MKSLSQFVNESENGFKQLSPVLKKTGWPSLKIDGDTAYSIDEDTKIEFKLDDWDNKPYISHIECDFATSDPAHLRDLNSLVELFEEINKM